MDKTQQRIKIAEACNKLRWTLLDNTRYPDCPDYLNDLNAMHEAEKLLTNMRLQVEWHNKRRTAFVVYKYMLRSVTNTSNSKYPTEWIDFCLLHATPAQRAEAFLKTFGKWEH